MSAPVTAEDLVELIRKSGVIDENLLSDYLRRSGGRGLPAAARDCAAEMVREAVITAFQAEQYLQGKYRGFTIGNYKLLERVGIGGMGQVFLCEHLHLKKRVAVKVLPPHKANQPSALGRFYREARAAASIEHPNVVRTHDIDKDGELHYIVMDYVNGPNLLDVVKKFGPMDVGRATSYIHQVSKGLDCAFRAGIIHRDLKPGNILIDRRGVARLLDLGLARFYTDNNDLLTLKYDEKAVLGTADYVAPEQVADSHTVDARADIYSLGATFYFLLAGHPPFPTGTVSQKLNWHCTRDPEPIRKLRPEVSHGLAAALEKMMAKDPKARFQSAAFLAEELSIWVPDKVALPGPQEIPRLSPAAAERGEEPASGVKGERSPARPRPTGAVATAPKPVATPRPAAAPKTAAGTRPPSAATWAGDIAAHIDTDDSMERTPSATQRPPASRNPFSGGDLTENGRANSGARSIPWALITAITVAVLAIAALIITNL